MNMSVQATVVITTGSMQAPSNLMQCDLRSAVIIYMLWRDVQVCILVHVTFCTSFVDHPTLDFHFSLLVMLIGRLTVASASRISVCKSRRALADFFLSEM